MKQAQHGRGAAAGPARELISQWRSPGWGNRRWLALGALVATSIAVLDASLGEQAILIGLLSLGPLVACLRGSPRGTAAVGLYAVVLAVAVGVPDGIFADTDHFLRTAVVVLSSVLSVRMAVLRERARLAGMESRNLVHTVFHSALDSIISMDGDGNIVDLNPAAEETFGLRRDEVLGASLCDTIVPERYRDAHRAGLSRLREGGEARILGERIELSALRADGEEFPVELSVTRADAGQDLYTGFIRDVGERKRADLERQQQAARDTFLVDAGVLLDKSLNHEVTLEQIARLAVDRICDWAFVELLQPDGSIKRVAMAHSDPLKESLVREYDERYPIDPDAPEGSAKVIRTGEPELLREIPDEMLELVAEDEEHLEIMRGLGFRSAMVVPLRARGVVIGDLALVSAESGRHYDEHDLFVAQKLATRCALAIDNARLYGEARASEERLRHQSLHDSLTGLPNRALFFDRLEGALARSDRREGEPALLFFDLDSFKEVNDTLGHLIGDAVLKAIPERLAGIIRAEDTISRFGGDEFAVICEGVDATEAAVHIADRLVAALREPFALEGETLQLGASVGIAFSGAGADTPDGLLSAADAAMYEAKRRGGNRYFIHGSERDLPPPPDPEGDAGAGAAEPVVRPGATAAERT